MATNKFYYLEDYNENILKRVEVKINGRGNAVKVVKKRERQSGKWQIIEFELANHQNIVFKRPSNVQTPYYGTSQLIWYKSKGRQVHGMTRFKRAKPVWWDDSDDEEEDNDDDTDYSASIRYKNRTYNPHSKKTLYKGNRNRSNTRASQQRHFFYLYKTDLFF
eukprot:315299_1